MVDHTKFIRNTKFTIQVLVVVLILLCFLIRNKYKNTKLNYLRTRGTYKRIFCLDKNMLLVNNVINYRNTRNTSHQRLQKTTFSCRPAFLAIY
jgi:hypothetical protein